MDGQKEGGQGRITQRSDWLSATDRPKRNSHTPRAVLHWHGWYSLALVGIVWSVCHVEAPLHPSLSPAQVFWRLLLVCMLCTGLWMCVLALRCCLSFRHRKVEPHQRLWREAMTEEHTSYQQYSWLSRKRGSSDQPVPLAHALTDSLLLCVLQEALFDPTLEHIQALLSRLEAVSSALQRADVLSETQPDGVNHLDTDPILIDKVKHTSVYLQQRTRSLRSLLQAQGELEAHVKAMLGGLEHLWAQLEELHTGVTLTKEWSQGHRDLSTVKMETENLSTVLKEYRSRLHHCQTQLEGSTQLLQQLSWSHTHTTHRVGAVGAESVWPELLLQSNIEQFDKVQERFFSLEQQTSTFRAHLDGLDGGGTQALRSCSVSPGTPRLCTEHTSDAPVGNHTNTPTPDSPRTLGQRSAMHFSTAIGRLRRSGKRK